MYLMYDDSILKQILIFLKFKKQQCKWNYYFGWLLLLLLFYII